MSAFNNILILLNQWSEKPDPFTSAQEASDHFCPFAYGVNNNGFICPSSNILCGNAAAAQWVDFIQFYDSSQLSYWLKMCSQHDPNTYIHIALENDKYGVHEHLLPFARYIPYPEQVVFRQGTVFELMGEMNIQTIKHLRTYIYALITFGIFLNDQMADTVYMIHNAGEYIAARTFGGVLDRGALMGSNRSGYLPAFGGDQSVYNSMPLYQSLQGPITPELFNSLMLNERTRLENTTFLGNETDTVLAMKDALKLSESYTDYLSKRGPISQEKVGPTVYKEIVLAQAPRKALRPSRPDREQAPMPLHSATSNQMGAPSSVAEWLAGPTQASLPFGGTETMNMMTLQGTTSTTSANSAVSDQKNNACVIC